MPHAKARSVSRRLLLAGCALLIAPWLGAQQTRFVGTDERFHTVIDAIQASQAGDRIVIRAGTYREPTILVDRTLEIAGDGLPTLDGGGARQIMTVTADDVSIHGLRFAHVGTSYVEDRAAIKLNGVHHCAISGNTVDDAMFGIYLANVTDCRIEHNVIHGLARNEAGSGNGIHLWSSRGVVIADNEISGQRDGIYFEFVHDTEVRGNISEHNLRYGLHFMYSDDCRYLGNTFRHNGSGVAVMFTHRVAMIGNRFEDNWGSAAYGLLLKEIYDSRLEHNVFRRNTVALFADGANRLIADRNDFLDNGWAIKLEASTQDGRFTNNNFVGNTFDVATNARELSTTFAGNYWDEYEGYDRNRDGVGDVPFRPVRLFSYVVAHDTPALILLRSAFVRLVDAAEKAFPALTPIALADTAPAMRRVR
jgi:nitrous oxidase accessory protein